VVVDVKDTIVAIQAVVVVNEHCYCYGELPNDATLLRFDLKSNCHVVNPQEYHVSVVVVVVPYSYSSVVLGGMTLERVASSPSLAERDGAVVIVAERKDTVRHCVASIMVDTMVAVVASWCHFQSSPRRSSRHSPDDTDDDSGCEEEEERTLEAVASHCSNGTMTCEHWHWATELAGTVSMMVTVLDSCDGRVVWNRHDENVVWTDHTCDAYS
jgi:hypothetical protein